MEQIYTIPVNEAFEKSMEDPAAGCPFCRLYNKLEQDELDLILGASMMEPDVRVKTNELGFCRDHFSMMIRRPKRLPLALVLESHLAEQNQNLGRGAMFIGKAGENAAKKFTTLHKSCYVCDLIEYNFVRMQETAALLWEQDEEFRGKTAAQPLGSLCVALGADKYFFGCFHNRTVFFLLRFYFPAVPLRDSAAAQAMTRANWRR